MKTYQHYIDGRWVKAAPAFNIELCARFGVRPTEFDGVGDALIVAGKHDHPLDAQLAKPLKDISSDGTLAVHEPQRSEVLSAASHDPGRHAVAPCADASRRSNPRAPRKPATSLSRWRSPTPAGARSSFS